MRDLPHFLNEKADTITGSCPTLVIFVSSLCSTERNDMPCIVPGVMPNLSFKLILMQEPLTVMLTLQKIQISAVTLVSSRVCGLSWGTGDGAGSCL